MNARRVRVAGFTLLELMIGLAVCGLIVLVSLQLYARGREVYRVNEQVARMQEQARLAFAVIQPDIEMAGLYGFTREPSTIRLIQGGNAESVVATAEKLRQFPHGDGDPMPLPVGGLPPGAHACGVNFAVDLSMPVQGSSNAFAVGHGATACNPYQGRAQAGADTLTLRRAATEPVAAEANRLQLYSARTTSQSAQWMFADGVPPGPVDANHRIHNVVVRTYYVARDSVGQRDFPALRVKSLTRSGSSLAFDEDEVMTGIEDFQVELGVAADGSFNGTAARYVEPDAPDLPSLQVVAVRVWLRVRADSPDPTFHDDRIYEYADVMYVPQGIERRYRRVVMSRTITLRNARVS